MPLFKRNTIELRPEDKRILVGLAMAAAEGKNNILQNYMAVSGDDYGLSAEDGSAKSFADIPMPTVQDFLATPSAQILIPKIVLGAMRETVEPMYIAVKFMEKIRMKSGQSMIFPSIGTIPRAYDIAEGQEVNIGASAA